MSKTWNDVKRVDGTAGNVWKYVFTKSDAVAEAVLYKYPTFNDRTVICCSTQSGCPIGCRFCGAGDKFIRSLTSEEIQQQVEHLLQDHKIDHSQVAKMQIMFMSMGEPMLNLQGLIPAMRALSTAYPEARLLISTSGPRVDYGPLVQASVEMPQIGLQFSVHESTDDARNMLVPFKAKLTLAEIAAEGEKWAAATGRQPFFNYCAHEKNTSQDDVDRLSALYNPDLWQCTVSVICERDEGVAAANARQRGLASDFMEKMTFRGYSTRMFDPASQDDAGAGCGQLWFVQKWMREHTHLGKASVGAGRPVTHAPHTEMP